MNNLKAQLIRLGSKRPDLRNHIRPVLDTITTGNRSRKEAKILYDHAYDWVIEHNKKVAGFLDGTWINEREVMAELQGSSQIIIKWDRMKIAGADVNPSDLSHIQVDYSDGQNHVDSEEYVELGQEEMAKKVATKLKQIAKQQLPSPHGGRGR